MSFFGFSGNGTVHTADATQVSNLLGSTTITAQLGSGALVPISVPLSVEFVQGLGSGFLGLTATVPVDSGDTVGIASLENSVPGFVNNPLFVRPTLRLETSGHATSREIRRQRQFVFNENVTSFSTSTGSPLRVAGL